VQADGQDDAIGAVFEGRYRIEAMLGRGGMGVVYRAHQLAVGRDVAVKVLHPALSADTATVDRFENEARVIANLRHPNTIKLVDVGRLPDARIFIVTELVEGRTLDELIASGLSLPAALGILVQVCDALSEAHQRGVVHRDLKPGNVMVERIGVQDVAKVLDFGIAKLAAQPKVTATGTVFGTPAYMSPEQAKGVPIDGRTDIYALGIMLYQVATGRLPFEATSPGVLMVRHITEEPPSPSEMLAGTDRSIPPKLEDLILQMLEKEPDDRPQSLDEVRRRLADPSLLEEGATAPPETPLVDAGADEAPTADWSPSDDHGLGTMEPRPSSRPVALWWAGVALLLLLGGWWMWAGGGGSGPSDTEALPIGSTSPSPSLEAPELEAPGPDGETERAPNEFTADREAAPTSAPRSEHSTEPKPEAAAEPPPEVAPSEPKTAKPRPSRRRRRPAEASPTPKLGRSSPKSKAPAEDQAPEASTETAPATPVPPGLQDVEL